MRWRSTCTSRHLGFPVGCPAKPSDMEYRAHSTPWRSRSGPASSVYPSRGRRSGPLRTFRLRRESASSPSRAVMYGTTRSAAVIVMPRFRP